MRAAPTKNVVETEGVRWSCVLRGGRDDGRATGCGISGAAVGFCELRVALLELCFCLTLLLFGRKHYGQEDGYHEVLHNRRGWGVMVQGN